MSRHRARSLAIVGAALCLSACSTGTPVHDDSTGVTLQLWHNSADTDALLHLYQRFEAASGITIELVDLPSSSYTKDVRIKWATGERPDLLSWSGNPNDVISLDAPNTLMDLTELDFVGGSGQLGQIAGTWNGRTYAATLGPLSIRGVFYNTAVLDAAGVEAPRDYDELATVCDAVKARVNGVDPIFEAAGSGYPQSILATHLFTAEANLDNAYVDAILAGTAELNDPDGAFVDGLSHYDALRTDECFNADAATARIEDARAAVWTGRAAMMADSLDAIPAFLSLAGGNADEVDARIGFAAPSESGSVASYVFSPLGSFVVPLTGDREKERAALAFIEYATGPGYQDYVDEAGIIPTIDTATRPTLHGLMRAVTDQFAAAASPGFTTGVPGFGQIGNETMKLTAGQRTPQQVADTMQALFEQANAALTGG